MSNKTTSWKVWLVVLGVLVAGWGLIILIGYQLFRGILSLMTSVED